MFVKVRAIAPHIKGLDIENPTILKFLYNRGVQDHIVYASRYQNTTLDDPANLFDVGVAAQKLLHFLKKRKRIVIYGDYDADGILSSFILYDFLANKLGYKKVWVWLPNRFNDGYGLNHKNLDYIKNFADVVITVDCGIRDKHLISQYAEDLDFLVIDHHIIPKEIPNVPIVHPLHKAGKNPNKVTSAGVTVYKFVSFLASLLNLNITYVQRHLVEYLEFAAITIITDVMPLVGENRTIVKYAYNKIRSSKPRSLHTFVDGILKTRGKRPESFDYKDFGFLIGPRLNAVGRIMDPNIAFSALLAPDLAKFQILDRVNTYRRELVDSINVADFSFHEENELCILAFADNISEGIIGLVAGNLTKTTNKLAIVCTFDQEGKIKCSGRSPKDINLIALLDKLQQKYSLFNKYGGHSQAAGLTLAESMDMEQFWAKLDQESNLMTSYKPFVLVDDILTPEDLNVTLIQELLEYAPFGPENEEFKLVVYGYVEKAKNLPSGKYLITLSNDRGTSTIDVFFKEMPNNLQYNKLYILGSPFVTEEGKVLFWGDQIVDEIEYIL